MYATHFRPGDYVNVQAKTSVSVLYKLMPRASFLFSFRFTSAERYLVPKHYKTTFSVVTLVLSYRFMMQLLPVFAGEKFIFGTQQLGYLSRTWRRDDMSISLI